VRQSAPGALAQALGAIDLRRRLHSGREPANLLSQFSDFPAQLFDFGAAGGRASARPTRHHADACQDHHTSSVAGRVLALDHGQMVRLMVAALDE
jgi:hypothetical protein